jgi:hypothetical protein
MLLIIAVGMAANNNAAFGTQQGTNVLLTDKANKNQAPKYLAYAYNSGRLNNQMESVSQHFRIAKYLGRTLVFPVRFDP